MKFLSVKLVLFWWSKQLPAELQNTWIEVASWRMSWVVYINQSSPRDRQRPLCSQRSSWQNKFSTYSWVFLKVRLDERCQASRGASREPPRNSHINSSIICSSVLSAAANRSSGWGILNQGGVVWQATNPLSLPLLYHPLPACSSILNCHLKAPIDFNIGELNYYMWIQWPSMGRWSVWCGFLD